jgi:hypothetical protein
MVPRMHHYKLFVQLMPAPECLAAGRIESRHLGMRPKRNRLHSIRGNAFINQPVSHESIQRDHTFRSGQSEVLQPDQGARNQRTFA